MTLSHEDHDRGAAGFEYVYPVVSRRAGGISIGVNLNPNNACNWRCVYCQVPGLRAGRAPRILVNELERQLGALLERVRDPDWIARNAPGAAGVRDIALSGNGEPTSARELAEVIEAIERQRRAAQLECALTLITNGSLAQHERVQAALARWRELGGVAWCKLDAGDDRGLARMNNVRTGIERAKRNLAACARACPTWVQTFAADWNGPTLWAEGLERYCDALDELRMQGVKLEGVLLYGMARRSHQREGLELRRLEPAVLEQIGQRIRARTDLEVRVSA